jgi:hypothetical protein
VRHVNLRSIHDTDGKWHVLAKGKRFETVCGLQPWQPGGRSGVNREDSTLLAWPFKDDACGICVDFAEREIRDLDRLQESEVLRF